GAADHWRDGAPRAPDRMRRVGELSRWLARQPGIGGVQSVVDLPGMTPEQAQQLAALPAARRPPPLAEAFRQTVGEHVIVLAVSASLPPGGDEARALVRALRSCLSATDTAL